MHRVVLSFLISFILLMIVIALNRITYENAQKETQLTEKSRNVIQLYDALGIDIKSAEIYSEAYHSTSASSLYSLYKQDIDSLGVHLTTLRNAVNENAAQAKIVDSIEGLVNAHLPALRKFNIPELIAAGDTSRFADILKIHLLLREGLRLEEEVLIQRREGLANANRQNNSLTLILAIFAIGIITATFLSQFFLSKRSKWLEGFLESILNTSQHAILHCKAVRQKNKIEDFKVSYANPASKSITGTEPRKIIGKKWSGVEALNNSGLFTVFGKVVEEDKPVQMEYLHVAGAEERWFSVSLAKMEDGVTVAFDDITHVKHYQEELKKNIDALQQSNQELEEYAYAASHDLQEPLRKIRTFSSVLQERYSQTMDEKGQEQLVKIMTAAERMTMLIKDLLTFSSLKQKSEFEPTDLNAILENVLQDFDMLIAQTGAVITHDPLPEIDAIPVQMNQLFYNLVSNSLKFGRHDIPLHVDISYRLLTPENVKLVPLLDPALHYHEIVFSDNGIGFNPDYAAQIFGLFKRLNDKARYAGSGIGLSLCKKVVVNHGGVIDATGKEGIGAQFYIYLPQKSVSWED